MIASSLKSAAIAVAIACFTIVGAHAQGAPDWYLHATLEGDHKPYVCKDTDTVGLIVAVLGRAIEAKANDADKAKRLFELAAKLEADICVKPTADDIVILRCKLDQKTFGDTNITLAKVSALLKSDSSAGEQPFYAWTYATINPSKDGGTSAQEADKRWCTEESTTDTPVEATPDLVQRVQQRFFDFGFLIPAVDGRLTPETVQAVIDFQKMSGLPPTGQLTKFTVDKIDATVAPSPWVSVAFDGYGNYNMVSALTRRAAEDDAITGFRRRSRGDYRVSSVPFPNCLAIAATRYRVHRTTYTQSFTSGGTSDQEARDTVLGYCGQQKGGGTCQVKSALCTAGGGQAPSRHDEKDLPINSPAPRFNPRDLPANSMAPGLSSEPEPDNSPDSSNPDSNPAPDAQPDRPSTDKPSDDKPSGQ
jgi:peptidoglycan hydrolase-like protein with peptidoglycan-binding domain